MPSRSEIIWPLWLWSAQLLPSAMMLALAALRLPGLMDGQSLDRKTALALIVGAPWLVATSAMLISPRGRRWVIERRHQWCLGAVAAGVGLIIFDVALTLFGIVPTTEDRRRISIDYSHGRFTDTRLVPKVIDVPGGEPIRINDRGFRGPEIDPVKQASTLRLVFVGGSQVFDYHGGGWPGMVRELLRDRGHPVEVINAGVPGHDSTDSVGKLMTDLWVLEPDVVFLCNTWNDAKYYKRLSPAMPYRGLPPPAPGSLERDWRLHPIGLDRWLTASAIYRSVRASLIEMLASEEGRSQLDTRDAATDARVLGPGSHGLKQFELNLRLAVTIAEHARASLVLCRQAWLEDGAGSGIDVSAYARRNSGLTVSDLKRAFELSNAVVDRVAADTGTPILDMHRALGDVAANFRDPIHFSPAGSREAARVVADFLEPYLVRRLE